MGYSKILFFRDCRRCKLMTNASGYADDNTQRRVLLSSKAAKAIISNQLFAIFNQKKTEPESR